MYSKVVGWRGRDREAIRCGSRDKKKNSWKEKKETKTKKNESGTTNTKRERVRENARECAAKLSGEYLRIRRRCTFL